MKVQNRILILVVTVLVSMGLIAAISLSVLRSNMMSERQNQLATLVELGKGNRQGGLRDMEPFSGQGHAFAAGDSHGIFELAQGNG